MTATPWFSQVEPAQTVADPDAFSWDIDTDLLVVGSGAAGSSAATEAVEQGLRVTRVDRYSGGGASAAISASAATRPTMQK